MVLPMACDTSAGWASPTNASWAPDRRESAKVRVSSGQSSPAAHLGERREMLLGAEEISSFRLQRHMTPNTTTFVGRSVSR